MAVQKYVFVLNVIFLISYMFWEIAVGSSFNTQFNMKDFHVPCICDKYVAFPLLEF